LRIGADQHQLDLMLDQVAEHGIFERPQLTAPPGVPLLADQYNIVL
jgi:hypothetical protein